MVHCIRICQSVRVIEWGLDTCNQRRHKEQSHRHFRRPSHMLDAIIF